MRKDVRIRDPTKYFFGFPDFSTILPANGCVMVANMPQRDITIPDAVSTGMPLIERDDINIGRIKYAIPPPKESENLATEILRSFRSTEVCYCI